MNTEDLENQKSKEHYFRFHLPHSNLSPTFGNDWFSLRAEAFARFFGTPFFLISQTLIVALWIAVNVLELTKFDQYPFILLNLAFSLQAAYAAPLILLAQTRQAERDKANSEADAKHREAIAQESKEREILESIQTEHLIELLKKNTELTEFTKELSLHIESLTREVHAKFMRNDK